MNEIIVKNTKSEYCKFGDIVLIDNEAYIVAHSDSGDYSVINLADGSLWDSNPYFYEDAYKDEALVSGLIEYIKGNWDDNEITIEYLGSRKITIE